MISSYISASFDYSANELLLLLQDGSLTSHSISSNFIPSNEPQILGAALSKNPQTVWANDNDSEGDDDFETPPQMQPTSQSILKIQQNNQEFSEDGRSHNYACARLIPYKPSAVSVAGPVGNVITCENKLLFSTSGLTVTNTDSVAQMAISTIGFNFGNHFWEFFCPISCESVEMGVISPSTAQEVLMSFNTTTPRYVSFKLSFEQQKLLVYLNGNLNEKKSSLLPILKDSEAKWYPCVKIKDAGVNVVFNPFQFSSDKPVSQYCNEINKKEKTEVIIGINSKTIIRNKVTEIMNILSEINQEEQQLHLPFVQQRVSLSSSLSSQSTPQKLKEENIMNPLQMFVNKNSMVLLNGDKLKLIRRDQEGNFVLNSGIFNNKVVNQNDAVTVFISQSSLLQLLNDNDWFKIIQNTTLTQHELFKFMESIHPSPLLHSNSGNNQKNQINKTQNIQITMPFIELKKIVDSILCYNSHLYLKQQDTTSTISTEAPNLLVNNNTTSLFGAEQKQGDEDFENKEQNCFDRLLHSIQAVLSLDEQLFAMTLHSQASQQLKNIYLKNLSRPFSSFSRLGSLICCTKTPFSQIELAESGLYNAYDSISSLRHFSKPQIRLDQFEYFQEGKSISSLLKQQLPNSRMLKGLQDLNIPLSTTINSIPFQSHSLENHHEKRDQNIWIVSPKDCQLNNYICTMSQDGNVNIWNTEVALVKIVVNDFSIGFVPQKELKGLWSTNDLKANMKNVENGLFYSSDLSSKSKSKNIKINNTTIKDPLLNKFKVQEGKGVFGIGKISKLCPLVAGVAFEQSGENCGIFRLRRFGFSPMYLGNFYKQSKLPEVANQSNNTITDANKNQNSVPNFTNSVVLSKLVNQLDGSLIEEQTMGSIEDSLLRKENNRLSIQTLEPIFMSGCRYSNDSLSHQEQLEQQEQQLKQKEKYKNDLFHQCWLNCSQCDISTTQIVDSYMKCREYDSQQQSSRQDSFNLCILMKSKDGAECLELRLYEVICDNINPYSQDSLQVQLVCSVLVSNGFLNSSRILSYNSQKEIAVLLENQFLSSIQLSQLPKEHQIQQSEQQNQQQFKYITQLGKISHQPIAYFTQNDNIIIVSTQKKENKKEIDLEIFPIISTTAPSSQNSATQSEIIDATQSTSLNDNLSNLLERCFSTEPLGNRSSGMIKRSSLFNYKTGLTAKKCFEKIINLHYPNNSALSHLEFTLNYELKLPKNQSELFEYNPSNQLLLPIVESNKNIFTYSSADYFTTACYKLSNTPSQSHLPLAVVASKGAQLSFAQQESVMICPNSDSFISNYPNSSFTFKHLHDKSLIVEGVVVHSSLQSQQGSYPIGCGLVFVSDYTSHFDMTQQFQGMSLADYKGWMKNRSLKSTPLLPWEPVGCFEFQDEKEVTRAEMDIIRPGRYIHLLPTNFRKSPTDYRKEFASGIIDIKYFGVEGKGVEMLERGAMQLQPINDQFQLNEVEDFKSLIESGKITITITLQEREEIQLKSSDLLIKTQVEIQDGVEDEEKINTQQKAKISSIKRVHYEIRSHLFEKNSISSIQILENILHAENHHKNLMPIEVTSYGYKPNCIHNNNNCRLITIDNNSSRKKVCKLLIENGLTEKYYIQSIQQLIQFMQQENGLIDQLHSLLKWDDLLLNQIIAAVNGLEGIAYTLQLFTICGQNFNFNQDIINSLLKNLYLQQFKSPINNSITKITFSQFQRLFILLKRGRGLLTQEVVKEIFKILDQSVISYQTQWNQYYSLLRCDHFITDFPFDDAVFEENIHPPLFSNIQNNNSIAAEIVSCKIECDGEGCVNRTFIIDQQEVIELDSVSLIFEKSNKVCAVRMKVDIYKVNSNSNCENGYQKILVYSNHYSSSTVYQLAVLAYQQQQLESQQYHKYQNNSNKNELQINLKNLSTRYLIIEISFSLFSYAATTTDISQAARLELYPVLKSLKHKQNLQKPVSPLNQGVRSTNSILHIDELFQSKISEVKHVKQYEQSSYIKYVINSSSISYLDSCGFFYEKIQQYNNKKKNRSNNNNKTKQDNSLNEGTQTADDKLSDDKKTINDTDKKGTQLDFQQQLQFVSNNFINMTTHSSLPKRQKKNKVLQPSLSTRAPKNNPNKITEENIIKSSKTQNSPMMLLSSSSSSILLPQEANNDDEYEDGAFAQENDNKEDDQDQDGEEISSIEADEEDDAIAEQYREWRQHEDIEEEIEECDESDISENHNGMNQITTELSLERNRLKTLLLRYRNKQTQVQTVQNCQNQSSDYLLMLENIQDIRIQIINCTTSIKSLQKQSQNQSQDSNSSKIQDHSLNNNNNNNKNKEKNISLSVSLSYLKCLIQNICKLLIDKQSQLVLIDMSNQIEMSNRLITNLFQSFVLQEVGDIVLDARNLISSVLLPLCSQQNRYQLFESILKSHLLDKQLSIKSTPLRLLSQINYLGLVTFQNGFYMLNDVLKQQSEQQDFQFISDLLKQHSLAFKDINLLNTQEQGQIFIQQLQEDQQQEQGESFWLLTLSLCLLLKNEYLKLVEENKDIDNSFNLQISSTILQILVNPCINKKYSQQVQCLLVHVIDLLNQIISRVSLKDLHIFLKLLISTNENDGFDRGEEKKDINTNFDNLLMLCLWQNENNSNGNASTSQIWQSLQGLLTSVLCPKQLSLFQTQENSFQSLNNHSIVVDELESHFQLQLVFLYHLQHNLSRLLHCDTYTHLQNIYCPHLNTEMQTTDSWLKHLKILLSLLATSNKIVGDFELKKNQIQPAKKLLEMKNQRRKSSEFSRRNSQSSRKGSEELINQKAQRSRSNTSTDNKRIILREVFNLPSLTEYIESASSEGQQLIMNNLILELTETMLPSNHSTQNKEGKKINPPNHEFGFLRGDKKRNLMEDEYTLGSLKDYIKEDENTLMSENQLEQGGLSALNNIEYPSGPLNKQLFITTEQWQVRWKTTFTAIQLLPGKSIQENGIFNLIVEKYILSNPFVQDEQLSSITTLTKIVLDCGYEFKDICENILTFVFQVIDKARARKSQYQQSLSSAQQRLIVDWLEMLLCKTYPPDEQFFSAELKESQLDDDQPNKESQDEQNINSTQQISCKLRAIGCCKLLTEISEFLIRDLNVGGIDGVLMGDEQLTQRLKIGQYLLKILLNSESSFHHLTIVEVFNKGNLFQEISYSLSKLIQYQIINSSCNKLAKKNLSPATISMNNIIIYVNQILKIAAQQHQSLAKYCLDELIRQSNNLYAVIQSAASPLSSHEISPIQSISYLKMQPPSYQADQDSKHTLPYSVIISIAQRQSKVFQELLNEWTIDDKAASFLLTSETFSHFLTLAGIKESLILNQEEGKSLNEENLLEQSSDSLSLMAKNILSSSASSLPWNSMQFIKDLTPNHIISEQKLQIAPLPKPSAEMIPPPLFNENSQIENQKEFGLQPQVAAQAYFSQIINMGYGKTYSGFEQGIFGNSEIHENSKSSFLKYQISHPSYLNSGNQPPQLGVGNNPPASFLAAGNNPHASFLAAVNPHPPFLNPGIQQQLPPNLQQAPFASYLAQNNNAIVPILGSGNNLFGSSTIHNNNSNGNQQNLSNSFLNFNNNFNNPLQYNIQSNSFNNPPNFVNNFVSPSQILGNNQLMSSGSNIQNSQNNHFNALFPNSTPSMKNVVNMKTPNQSHSPGSSLKNLNAQYLQKQSMQNAATMMAPLVQSGTVSSKFQIIQDFIQKFQSPSIPSLPNPPQFSTQNVATMTTASSVYPNQAELVKDPQIFGIQNFSEISNQQTKNLSNNLKSFVETECANQIQLLASSGMFGIYQSPLDWSCNKKGAKGKVFFQFMIENNHYELPLLFKLNKFIEIQKIRIGFNTFLESQDSMLGVPTVIAIEGGDSESNLHPLGKLELFNDEKYTSFGVKVFAKNFWRMNSEEGTISQSIKSLINPRVSYVKLRIFRPTINVMEDTFQYGNRCFGKIGVSVNFLSIMGYNMSLNAPTNQSSIGNNNINIMNGNIFQNQFMLKQQQQQQQSQQYQQQQNNLDNSIKVSNYSTQIFMQINKIRQQSILSIIGKISASGNGYDQTMNIISNSQNVLQQVKQNIDTLIQLLTSQSQYETIISDLLLSLSYHNYSFANWLFDQLFIFFKTTSNNCILAKLISKIIICQPTHPSLSSNNKDKMSNNNEISEQENFFSKLKKLMRFIEQELKRILLICQDNTQQIEIINQEVSQLLPFIEALILSIQMPIKVQLKQSKIKVNSNIIFNSVEILQYVLENKHSNKSTDILLKLVANLLYLPTGYGDQNFKLKFNCLEILWNSLKQSVNMHSISDALVILCRGGKESRQFFCSRIPDLAELLVRDLNAIGNQQSNSIQEKNSSEFKSFKQPSNEIDQNEQKEIAMKTSFRARGLVQVLQALGKDLVSISKTIQSQPLHLALFSFFKNSKGDMGHGIFKDKIDKDLISAFQELLAETSFSSNSGSKELAEVLVADTKKIRPNKDNLFVSQLLSPLLTAKLTIPVCFHAFDHSVSNWVLYPLQLLQHPRFCSRFRNATLLNAKIEEKFSSELLTPVQKNSFIKTFKKITKETGIYKKLKHYAWTRQVVQEYDGQGSLTKILEEQVLNNPPYVVVMQGTTNGIKCICGVFCTQALSSEGPEFGFTSYKITSGEDCFMFYYSEDYQLHFRIEGSELGSLEIAENHSFLSYKCRDIDRITISLSPTSTSFVDINLFDMKVILFGEKINWNMLFFQQPIQNGKNHPIDISNDFQFTQAEYWVLKPLGQSVESKLQNSWKSTSHNTQIESEGIFETAKSFNQIFPSEYFKKQSPYNIYRVPPVYHFPATMTLKEVISKMNFPTFTLPTCILDKFQVSLRMRPNLELPKNLENLILKEIRQFSIQSNGIIDFDYNIEQFFTDSISDESPHKSTSALKKVDTNHFLKMFVEAKGVEAVLEAIQSTPFNFKDPKRTEQYVTLIKELKQFSILQNFNYELIQGKSTQKLLFDLLSGERFIEKVEDLPTGKDILKDDLKLKAKQLQDEEQDRKAYQEIYDIVGKALSQDSPDHKIKQVALKNNLIQVIFDKISQISKEHPREFVEDILEAKAALALKKANDLGKKTKEQQSPTNQPGVQNEKKKKGVGYGSDNQGGGNNSSWNTNEYLEQKKNMNTLLLSLVKAVSAFLTGSWKIPQLLEKVFCCSSLLKLLENALISGSLLEMSKESDLMLEYLKIIELISQHDHLLNMLLPLGIRYKPPQSQSIQQLIQNLSKTANVFLHCLQPEQISQNEDKISKQNFLQQLQQKESQQQLTDTNSNTTLAQKIASRIIQVNEKVEQALEKQRNNKRGSPSSQQQSANVSDQNKEMNRIMNSNEREKYKILLQNLRFGYVSMEDKQTGEYLHHYKQNIQQSTTSHNTKLVRLAQEVADMSTSLPVDYTNSVFVRCDLKRVDVMKCLIMGSSGTPYAHGAFLYDVFFEDNYPNSSPKVNLQTTGPDQVRFNPNLYQCGKVCLSLLGTWKGQASENWDPKISTLMQVLLSLQSIIMTEDVYFNEPGFEGQSGSEEGEKKNEGYSNIVKYFNIKIAMIKQIKNPPPGFEEVIRRHFFLKRETILSDCEQWLDRSYKKPASYTGLVSDHNPKWCTEFKQPGKFSSALAEAIKELKEVLLGLPQITSIDPLETIQRRRSTPTSHQRFNEQKLNLIAAAQNKKKPILEQAAEEEEEEQKEDKDFILKHKEEIFNESIKQEDLFKQYPQEEMDVNSEEIKDRWSRYICALGIDAVTKQSKCSVFLSGANSLGAEIGKNLVLSGLKRLTIRDEVIVEQQHLENNFLLEKTSIGKNRAKEAASKLQRLNKYARVDQNTNEICNNLTSEQLIQLFQLNEYQIVILADALNNDIIANINQFCRKNNIIFIFCNALGPFSRIFNDFGDKFVVLDSNGEEFKPCVIQNIEYIDEHKTLITLNQNQTHGLQDGDFVTFSQVNGMDKLINEISFDCSTSVNGSKHKVLVVSQNSFQILSDTSIYSKYLGSGIVQGFKCPIELKFQSYSSSLEINSKYLDPNLAYHDFTKLHHSQLSNICFNSLSSYLQTYNNHLPEPWNEADTIKFIKLALPIFQQYCQQQQQDLPSLDQFNHFAKLFASTLAGTLHPLCAFIGGVVSQEAIKGMTNKFMPIQQLFYTDCMEVVFPSNNKDQQQQEKDLDKLIEERRSEYKLLSQKNNNSLNTSNQLQIVIGSQSFKQLQHLNVFLVGSGAIGCELLKNFAMIQLCTGEQDKSNNSTLRSGKLFLTDPDHIETSNLNRQFLFRQEHIGKSKSNTAAASIIQMNNSLKNHIISKQDKVCEASKDIFPDEFFKSQDIVANALDNIQARRYVDKRCIQAQVPLLESGTLGPKGHVQVIVPFLTESYGSQEDPQEEGGDIPHCTLKMFPEETLHCVEWARDKFGKIATLKPRGIQCIIEQLKLQDKCTNISESELQKCLKALQKRESSFEDCIKFAVRKFFKYLRNNILQLLHTYPPNIMNKDGSLFWKLPKKMPREIKSIDPNNIFHRDFITSVAIIRAKVFNIIYPSDFRSEQRKIEITKLAQDILVEDFVPSDEKGEQIQQQVEKNQDSSKQQPSKEEEIEVGQTENNVEDIINKIKQLIQTQDLKSNLVNPQEFEKDNDSNGHIDFIYSLANCRAWNYALPEMDWLTVKLKAGKIVPALATTTSAIAGLQTIELLKQVIKLPLEQRKNTFLNLSTPFISLTEPGAVPKHKITDEIYCTIWDRWEVQLDKSELFEKIIKHFEQTKKLSVFNILFDQELIFANTMSEKEKQSILQSSIQEIFLLSEDHEEQEGYIDIDILFTELKQNKILSHTPPIRILLHKTYNNNHHKY